MDISSKHDVIIVGGGLAGLTLALQLKNSKPDISILVLEKRSRDAPLTTNKVGESISELGAAYLRETLDLKDYLAQAHLPKLGFRFFFSPEHSDNIAKRVEVGSRLANPYPTHHVDRGLLENDLVEKLMLLGVEIVLGATVRDVTLSKTGHKIQFNHDSDSFEAESKWLVDSSGRNGFLKKKLGLQKQMDHSINAAWFRLDSEIDIDGWSNDLTWRDHVEPGLRRLATNHLLGKGYWVWLIPLISGKTSIGIVADPAFHSFDQFNTFEKAMQWLQEYEPLAAKMIGEHKAKKLDFKVMKHIAYDIKQFYSSERWGITGEAGAFIDPFYSPGTDFIGLGNTWITDLILKDLAGEDIAMQIRIYEHIHKEMLSGWTNLYRNMYGILDKTQVMLMKIVWDWASYWSVPCVLFINKGYTNRKVLKQFSDTRVGIGQRFARLNESMQSLFRVWGRTNTTSISGYYRNVFDLHHLKKFQLELTERIEPEDLIKKIESNLIILEQIAAEIFRLASSQIHGTPLDMKINPYTMLIEDGKELLIDKSKNSKIVEVDELVRRDIEHMWLSQVPKKEHEYAR